MRYPRVIALVGFYLLFVALLGYWILAQDSTPTSVPLRTRPPAARR